MHARGRTKRPNRASPSVKALILFLSRHRFLLLGLIMALSLLLFYNLFASPSMDQSQGSLSRNDELDSIPSHTDSPELPSLQLSSGFKMHAWLKEEYALGWCSSALHSISECKSPYPPCLVSPINDKVSMDTFQTPFSVRWDKKEECEEAIRGQLPLNPGHAPQVSFILIVGPSSESDKNIARLIIEIFLTSKEAASIELSVYRQMDAARTHAARSPTTKALQTLKKHFKTSIVYQSGRLNRAAAMQKAAVSASGMFLLFIGSESAAGVSLTPGWLTALLFTTHRMPLFGAVGCLNLDPRDRSISEAGGLLFTDGLTTIYNKDSNTQGKQTLYARRVDFVSTHCMMMKRQLFLALDGLDLASVSSKRASSSSSSDCMPSHHALIMLSSCSVQRGG
jgi:hypothetical protein